MAIVYQLIHCCKTNVEMFNYLKSYLMCTAAKVIDGLSLTNDNYDKAMLLLKEDLGTSK